MREERKKVKEPNAAGAAMTAAPVVDAAAPAVVADPVMEKEGGMVDVPETEEFDAPLETGTVVMDTLESGGEVDVGTVTDEPETVDRVTVEVVELLGRDEELVLLVLDPPPPPPPPPPSWRIAACRKVSMLSFGPGLTIMTIP